VSGSGRASRTGGRRRRAWTSTSRWPDTTFDAAVCFGGPLSYVLDDAERCVAELVRVTKPGGYVLLSVMSLVGTILHYLPLLLDLVRRDGADKNEEIIRTGFLSEEPDYGHLAMKLYRWSELETLLSRHGTTVARLPQGCCRRCDPTSRSSAHSCRASSWSSRPNPEPCRAASTSSRSSEWGRRARMSTNSRSWS
jgi:SAM-dependent methyltransferase